MRAKSKSMQGNKFLHQYCSHYCYVTFVKSLWIWFYSIFILHNISRAAQCLRYRFVLHIKNINNLFRNGGTCLLIFSKQNKNRNWKFESKLSWFACFYLALLSWTIESKDLVWKILTTKSPAKRNNLQNYRKRYVTTKLSPQRLILQSHEKNLISMTNCRANVQ